MTPSWKMQLTTTTNAKGTKVGLRPQPKDCHRRAPAHLSAYSSGDFVPRPPRPSAVHVIAFNSILENIDDVSGRGTKALLSVFGGRRLDRRRRPPISDSNPWPAYLLALLLMQIITAALGAAELTVALRPSTVLDGGQATVAAIAELGGDVGLQQRAGPLVLQELHDAASYRFDAVMVRARLRQLLPEVEMSVTGTANVRRRLRTYSAEELSAVALADARQRAGDGAVQVRVERPPAATAVLAPLAGAEQRIVAESLSHRRSGSLPYRIMVREGERELHRALAVIQVHASVAYPVAAVDLPRGRALQLQDLRLEHLPLDGRVAAGVGMNDLVGRVLSVPVTSGQPVLATLTTAPVLVRAGAPVQVHYRDPDFVISATATAVSDGAAGEVIRVRQEGGRVVRAQVQDDGSLVINF